MPRVVSAPMGAVSTGRGKVATLTHWCEVSDDGDVVRVLCGRAKPEHILSDAAMFNVREPDCPRCRGKAPRRSHNGT